MVDVAKRIRSSCTDDLEPGEEVLAGTYGQPVGTSDEFPLLDQSNDIESNFLGLQRPGRRGTDERRRWEERRQGNRGQEDRREGLARYVPSVNSVLGLSDRRFLVFARSSETGKPQGLVASYALHQVRSITIDDSETVTKIVVTFSDDTVAEFEGTRGAEPGSFAATFEGLSAT